MNRGQGKGVATYCPQAFYDIGQSNDEDFQTITIESNELAITNVYRSHNAQLKYCMELQRLLNDMKEKNHLIMGDFNYCIKNQRDHNVSKILRNNGYNLVNNIVHQPPEATQIKGRVIDHAWIKITTDNLKVLSHTIKTCIFSDHEKLQVEISF